MRDFVLSQSHTGKNPLHYRFVTYPQRCCEINQGRQREHLRNPLWHNLRGSTGHISDILAQLFHRRYGTLCRRWFFSRGCHCNRSEITYPLFVHVRLLRRTLQLEKILYTNTLQSDKWEVRSCSYPPVGSALARCNAIFENASPFSCQRPYLSHLSAMREKDLLRDLFLVEHFLPKGQSSTWSLSFCPRPTDSSGI